MASLTKSIRNRPLAAWLLANWQFAVSRRVWPISLAVFVCVLAAPSLVHAHGVGGEEVGPPLVISGLLGFVCYWLVVLWPSAKRKGAGSSGQSGADPRLSHAIRIKRKPRLRIIETRSQFPSDQNSGRRAGNG
jgi:hypothetical protein